MILDGPALNAYRRLVDFPASWHVAGGWAIDLHLERKRREHKDIDIAIARQDQLLLEAHLADCKLVEVRDHEFVPHNRGDILRPPRFQIFADNATPDGIESWEFLLEDYRDGQWTYRRNPVVTLPVTEAHFSTSDGIPYLAPEIVLLFKAKQVSGLGASPNDDLDFLDSVETLSERGHRWLVGAIRAAWPDHSWLASL